MSELRAGFDGKDIFCHSFIKRDIKFGPETRFLKLDEKRKKSKQLVKVSSSEVANLSLVSVRS